MRGRGRSVSSNTLRRSASRRCPPAFVAAALRRVAPCRFVQHGFFEALSGLSPRRVRPLRSYNRRGVNAHISKERLQAYQASDPGLLHRTLRPWAGVYRRRPQVAWQHGIPFGVPWQCRRWRGWMERLTNKGYWDLVHNRNDGGRKARSLRSKAKLLIKRLLGQKVIGLM